MFNDSGPEDDFEEICEDCKKAFKTTNHFQTKCFSCKLKNPDPWPWDIFDEDFDVLK